MATPLIGITLDTQEVTNSRGTRERRYWIKQAMVDAVRNAGGEPVLLPFVPNAARAANIMAAVQGLIISGGDFDIDPTLYGEHRMPQCGPSVPERTKSESLLLAAALKQKKPVLGICGGCQLINVHFGGTLHQDIPAQKPSPIKHSQPQPHAKPTHTVRVAATTRLRSLMNAGSIKVNSTHHQAVKAPGRGLIPSAIAPDGIIEGVETADGRFVLGVQWHPEFLTRFKPHAALFSGLVKAAKPRR